MESGSSLPGVSDFRVSTNRYHLTGGSYINSNIHLAEYSKGLLILVDLPVMVVILERKQRYALVISTSTTHVLKPQTLDSKEGRARPRWPA